MCLKRVAKVLFFILGGIFLFYLMGVGFFTQYYQPNTSINGIDISLQKKDDLRKVYEANWENYELKIEGRGDKSDRIKATDFDYIQHLKKGETIDQNPTLWPMNFWMTKDYKLDTQIDYNEDKLNELIQEFHVVKDGDIKDPTPAYLDFNEQDGYFVRPHDPGNRVDVELLKKKLLKSFFLSKEEMNLENEDVYLVAEGADEDFLNNKAKSYNEIRQFTLTYPMGEKAEVLSAPRLFDLYTEQEDGSLKVSEDQVRAFVGYMSNTYDTYKGTRDFQATGGQMVRVSGGIYGWQMDQEKMVEELLAALEAEQTREIKPVYKREAQVMGANDIGNSYIEIDIARQHLWLYRDGNLIVETPVVTGDPTKGNGTPTGTHAIWSRERNRYLTGDTWKSWVNYWLPFDWRGDGLHDSSWRSSYGGNIYRGGGSHGCVNVPPGKAPTVYENTFHGMPVIVYNSATQGI